MACDINSLSFLRCVDFFPLFFFHSCVSFVVLGKVNANPDHPDYAPSIFSFTKPDTVKNIQKFRRFSNLQKKNTEKSTHSEEVPKKSNFMQ